MQSTAYYFTPDRGVYALTGSTFDHDYAQNTVKDIRGPFLTRPDAEAAHERFVADLQAQELEFIDRWKASEGETS